MQNVYLNIGSNINKQRNIKSALGRLEELFGKVSVSSVYESASVGFVGDNFYNLAVLIRTDLPIKDLSRVLKQVEDEHDRNRQDKDFKGRTLDIDIVLYGTETGNVEGIELPRPELYFNGFVLKPMAELAGNLKDPKTGLTYQQLWATSKAEINQNLRLISL